MAKQLLKSLLIAGTLLGAPVQAVPTLTLAPVGGVLSGTPGSTVGWGFAITNDSDYLLVTGADFTPTPMIGSFTDFIGQFNFIVVGPPPESTSVSQTFDLNALTGVGSFAINTGASVGDTATGMIEISYDLFSVSPNDPNFNPDTDTLSTGNILSANASVAVTAPSGQTPEPGILALLFAGSLPLVGVSRKRCRL